MDSFKLSAAALIIAGSASADFAGATFTVEEAVDGYDTYKIYVTFNNPTDQLFSIDGTEQYGALFYEGGELYNVASVTPFGTITDDVGQYAAFEAFAGDSFVTIGGQEGDVTFSPDLFGNVRSANNELIHGSSFRQDTNGGYFDFDPTTAANDIDGSGILVAQLTVASGEAMKFGGTVSYESGTTGELAYGGFVVPAPGALALLGLAGLGRRRRG